MAEKEKTYSILAKKNSPEEIESSMTKESDYFFTQLYGYIPHYYMEKFAYSDPNAIICTDTPDENGKTGYIKLGVTHRYPDKMNRYPTHEDNNYAFLHRYGGPTDHHTSDCPVIFCVLKGDHPTIDKNAMDILECIANFRHPEHRFIRSDKERADYLDLPHWEYNEQGILVRVNRTPVLHGTEFGYNFTSQDVFSSFNVYNSIERKWKLDSSLGDILNYEPFIKACRDFENKLISDNSKKYYIERNKLKKKEITTIEKIDYKKRIIEHSEEQSNKKNSYVLTPDFIIDAIGRYIAKDNREELVIALSGKTYEDVLNMAMRVKNHISNKKCEFIYISSYYKDDLLENCQNDGIIYINRQTFEKIWMLHIDYLVNNPPYAGPMSTDYFVWNYEMQRKNKGKLIFIEPAKTYFDVRNAEGKRRNAWMCNSLREMMDADRCVEDIRIENYNFEFQTNQAYPHAITFIDFTKKHSKANYSCFGEHRKISSIVEESNQFGFRLSDITRVIDKFLKAFPERLSEHTVKEKKKSNQNTVLDGFEIDNKRYDAPEGSCFIRYSETIIGSSGSGFAKSYGKDTKVPAYNDAGKFESVFGTFVSGYLSPNYHPNWQDCHPDKMDEISTELIRSNKSGDGQTGDKVMNLFGTREELENHIWNSKNNPLMLFMMIVYTIDQNNRTKNITPWITDRKYSAKETFDRCGLTKEERIMVMEVIYKFDRNGAWFMRYILGTSQKQIRKLRNTINRTEDKGIPEEIKNILHVVTDKEVKEFLEKCHQRAVEYVERECM